MTVFALPRQHTTPFTVVGLSTTMLASAASSQGRPSLATHPAFARLPLFRSDCEQERRFYPYLPPARIQLSKNGHTAKTPWEPDLAVTTRSNHHSCLDKSAHPTFSILQEFFRGTPWRASLATRNLSQIPTHPWKRKHSSTVPHPPKPSAAAKKWLCPKQSVCGSSEQEARDPSHIEWHNFVLYRREALSMLFEQFSRARRNCQAVHALWLLPARCRRQA